MAAGRFWTVLDGRSAEFDVVVTKVDQFRRHGGHGRYALSRTGVVIDRLDGKSEGAFLPGFGSSVGASGRFPEILRPAA
ncbi:hypothetical protein OG896_20025 [Streptomyces sp. NBC_00669]|uniref:hypothetical protein n=1 Tax=Streptomyces sp. NBC_00669 TaxID=2976011 RepID=UPI002E314CD2|nr:hypothetical protein [Streptomyces sp. NBC_00669]